MRPRRQSGFTLLELAITMVGGVLVFGAVASWAVAVHADGAAAEATVRQRREAGIALDYLGRDVRQSIAASVKDGALELVGSAGGEPVRYGGDRALVRREGAEALVLARGLDEARFEARPEGCLVRLSFVERFGGHTVRTRVERLVVRPGAPGATGTAGADR